MPDFQYQPPTGPLSGSEFERQTTRFFWQVQGAADAAQSTAIAAQITANEAIERAQASNLVDGKTTQADAGGVITVKDVAIEGDIEDLASARGIFDTLTKGSVDCNTLTEQGVYAIHYKGTVNGPGFPAKLIVFNGKNGKNTNQMALGVGAVTSGSVCVAYRSKNSEDIWSPWSEGILSGRIGDGLRFSGGRLSVPEYDGATASTAGTSGLVPPAAAGQATYVLCGDGEWRDIATLVAAAQARLAESVKAEEGAL